MSKQAIDRLLPIPILVDGSHRSNHRGILAWETCKQLANSISVGRVVLLVSHPSKNVVETSNSVGERCTASVAYSPSLLIKSHYACGSGALKLLFEALPNGTGIINSDALNQSNRSASQTLDQMPTDLPLETVQTGWQPSDQLVAVLCICVNVLLRSFELRLDFG
jgi:hypothetical protein